MAIDPDQREQLLTEVCASDDALRNEMEGRLDQKATRSSAAPVEDCARTATGLIATDNEPQPDGETAHAFDLVESIALKAVEDEQISRKDSGGSGWSRTGGPSRYRLATVHADSNYDSEAGPIGSDEIDTIVGRQVGSYQVTCANRPRRHRDRVPCYETRRVRPVRRRQVHQSRRGQRQDPAALLELPLVPRSHSVGTKTLSPSRRRVRPRRVELTS